MAADIKLVVTKRGKTKGSGRHQHGLPGNVGVVDLENLVGLISGTNRVHGAGVKPAALPAKLVLPPDIPLEADEMHQFPCPWVFDR